jgi:hypothetical protein
LKDLRHIRFTSQSALSLSCGEKGPLHIERIGQRISEKDARLGRDGIFLKILNNSERLENILEEGTVPE